MSLRWGHRMRSRAGVKWQPLLQPSLDTEMWRCQEGDRSNSSGVSGLEAMAPHPERVLKNLNL